MKNSYLFVALAALALGSCTSEGFVGENEELLKETKNGTAIVFSSVANQNLTRAAGTAEDAQRLGYTFAVYGTKTVGTTTSNVFAQGEYSSDDNTPYWVWYEENSALSTTSNTHNWEYVGVAGNKTIPGSGTFSLSSDQTIKYWDYSASQYDFIAYKATSTVAPTISNVTTNGFKVTATAEQLAGLYIADKKVITEKNNTPGFPNTTIADNIGDVVQFTFRAAGAKVRLGIFETIPGYAVSAITFHYNNTTSDSNAGLDGSFIGASSGSQEFTVTYDETTKKAILAGANTANTTYFDFGSFTVSTTSLLGETSTAPTWATGTSEYTNVLPNSSNVGAMTLAVDYTLYNATTKETINVTGAKAVVPSNYMMWNPNFAYTYLFKISDNTNGTTGTVGTSPEGLYPITFDAIAIANQDATEGSITTVSTPAITTYQESSVSSAGITYAVSEKPIYVTVNTDGTLATLTSSNTKLYTVAEGTSEAELQLDAVTKTAASGLSVLSANETVNSTTFVSDKAVKFTPSAAGTYAIEYTDESSVKHYKVIVVGS